MGACFDALKVPVFDGTDNTFAIGSEAEGGGYMESLAAITRVTLQVGETLIDSATAAPGVVWWNETTLHRGKTIGIVRFRLGGLGLAKATYDDCAMKLFDAEHPNGIRNINPIEVTVR